MAKSSLSPPGNDASAYPNGETTNRLVPISGSEDHLMPPSIQKSNAEHYKSNTTTEVKVFEGRAHLMPAQKGWEEVADYALAWAEQHAAPRAAVAG
jgi:hypothetical protein